MAGILDFATKKKTPQEQLEELATPDEVASKGKKPYQAGPALTSVPTDEAAQKMQGAYRSAATPTAVGPALTNVPSDEAGIKMRDAYRAAVAPDQTPVPPITQAPAVPNVAMPGDIRAAAQPLASTRASVAQVSDGPEPTPPIIGSVTPAGGAILYRTPRPARPKGEGGQGIDWIPPYTPKEEAPSTAKVDVNGSVAPQGGNANAPIGNFLDADRAASMDAAKTTVATPKAPPAGGALPAGVTRDGNSYSGTDIISNAAPNNARVRGPMEIYANLGAMGKQDDAGYLERAAAGYKPGSRQNLSLLNQAAAKRAEGTGLQKAELDQRTGGAAIAQTEETTGGLQRQNAMRDQQRAMLQKLADLDPATDPDGAKRQAMIESYLASQGKETQPRFAIIEAPSGIKDEMGNEKLQKVAVNTKTGAIIQAGSKGPRPMTKTELEVEAKRYNMTTQQMADWVKSHGGRVDGVN